jgi:hypothetical protein
MLCFLNVKRLSGLKKLFHILIKLKNTIVLRNIFFIRINPPYLLFIIINTMFLTRRIVSAIFLK